MLSAARLRRALPALPSNLLRRLLPCVFGGLLWASPAPAAELQFRAVNQNLEEGRALLGKARFEEALEELRTAESLPGNTNRHLADIQALRASALLGLAPSTERKLEATAALVALWHVDPEGSSLAGASELAKSLALSLRGERALVLHDRLVTVRTGRPARVRARLSGPQGAPVQLFLRYRLEPENSQGSDLTALAGLADPEEYAKVALDPAGTGAEAYLRPGVGGVPAEGEHVLRYYLEAVGPGGALLDSNGTARDPIRVQLSATRAEGSGVGGADAIIATLDEGGHLAHPPPPPSPPWYKRWQILAPIGGALVIGGTIAALVLQPRPQPASGSLGRVDLP